MKSDWNMDLQLFAEAGGEGEAGEAVPAGGEPTPSTPGNPDNAGAVGSILGNAGKTQDNPDNNPSTNDNAAGVPDAYDFTGIVPEGMQYDEQSAKEFGNIARECGLSQEQAAKVAQYGMQYMQSGVQAAMQQVAATHAQWGEDAKKALGADFDKTVSRAAVGINRLERNIPGLRQVLNETGAGNRIEMINLMAAIGDMLGEDGGHGVAGYHGEKSLYPNTNFGQYR